jgi:hypothetical protein
MFSIMNIGQRVVSPPSRGLRLEFRTLNHKSYFFTKLMKQ